jgi:hypothetical protein
MERYSGGRFTPSPPRRCHKRPYQNRCECMLVCLPCNHTGFAGTDISPGTTVPWNGPRTSWKRRSGCWEEEEEEEGRTK